MKTRAAVAMLTIFIVSTPLLASAKVTVNAESDPPQSQTDVSSKTTLNCQWTPGNEAKGGNWGCADKDHSRNR